MMTPMPRIERAYRAKIDFLIKTNPFGSSKKDKPDQPVRRRPIQDILNDRIKMQRKRRGK
jgi:hypothetical protein